MGKISRLEALAIELHTESAYLKQAGLASPVAALSRAPQDTAPGKHRKKRSGPRPLPLNKLHVSFPRQSGSIPFQIMELSSKDAFRKHLMKLCSWSPETYPPGPHRSWKAPELSRFTFEWDKPMSSAWNKALGPLFAQNFIATHPAFSLVSEDTILDWFLQHALYYIKKRRQSLTAKRTDRQTYLTARARYGRKTGVGTVSTCPSRR